MGASSVTQAYSNAEIRPFWIHSITNPTWVPESSITVLVSGDPTCPGAAGLDSPTMMSMLGRPSTQCPVANASPT